MKTRLLMGVLFVAGAVAGALPMRLLGTSPDVTLEFQNARLMVTRAPLPDGGTSQDVAFRACGYLSVDGGRVAEPCWAGTLTPEQAAPVVTQMLATYDGGR